MSRSSNTTALLAKDATTPSSSDASHSDEKEAGAPIPMQPLGTPLPWDDAVRDAFLKRLNDALKTAYQHRPRYPLWKWIVHCIGWGLLGAMVLSLIVFFIALGVPGDYCLDPALSWAQCPAANRTNGLYERIGESGILEWTLIPTLVGPCVSGLLIWWTLAYNGDPNRRYKKPYDVTCDPRGLLFTDPAQYGARVGAYPPCAKHAAMGGLTLSWIHRWYGRALEDFLRNHQQEFQAAADATVRAETLHPLVAAFYDETLSECNHEHLHLPCDFRRCRRCLWR